MTIRENWLRVCETVASAAVRAGREPGEIQIVCVTKTVDLPEVREAFAAGAHILGENRVQEGSRKRTGLSDLPVRWDLIGHLQTNKVKAALETFDFIHSVDSLRLGREVARRAKSMNREVSILLEVNIFGENSKYGLRAEDAEACVGVLAEEGSLRLEGLMTMAPWVDDPEDTRQGFSELRRLAEKIRDRGIERAPMAHLSMGMTNDFPVAVEEGATLVRIGSAIFRP
jgi:pyridoxal phosphate enzyme (YggS family)